MAGRGAHLASAFAGAFLATAVAAADVDVTGSWLVPGPTPGTIEYLPDGTYVRHVIRPGRGLVLADRGTWAVADGVLEIRSDLVAAAETAGIVHGDETTLAVRTHDGVLVLHRLPSP